MALVKKSASEVQEQQSGTTESTYVKPDAGKFTTWGEHQWEALDVTEVNKGGGKFEKKYDFIGTVNFLMELGYQPDNMMVMKSNINAPAEGEDYSPEEIARMKDFPKNEFFWDTEYDANGKSSSVRKVKWPIFPEEEIVIAVDFPAIKLNYALHPYSNAEEGTEDIKECRIDWNGRWKGAFNRKINNTPNWKTKRLGDKSVQYKIATACGNLETYINDGHQLADLAGAVCNFTVKMTKKVDGDKVFYSDMEISNPTPIQDIKGRHPYTIAEQLEDNKSSNEVCGIQLNGGTYEEDELKQVRFMWWKKVMQATQFDKNEGSNRTGEWLEGANWADSDLAKACAKFKIDLPNQGGSQPAQENSAKESTVKPKEDKPAPKKEGSFDEEVVMDFEDDSVPSSRDQLLVSGKLLGEPVHVIVAHWPSKRGGAKKSDPKRNQAGGFSCLGGTTSITRRRW